MPCCSVVIVVAHSVSPRLFVSGCTIHSRPVRLIRHSSEEAAGHRIFISCFPTEAELRNGPRSSQRDAVLISPGLQIPLRPTSHSSHCTHILSMLKTKKKCTVHSEFTDIVRLKPTKRYTLIPVSLIRFCLMNPIWENCFLSYPPSVAKQKDKETHPHPPPKWPYQPYL